MVPQRNDTVWLEFHVSREARDRYQFDESLFSLNGSVVFANFRAARLFAQKMNQRRDLVNYPEQAVRAGQINAMGLIHEITHYVFKMYRDEHPGMMQEALASLTTRLGKAGVDASLERFVDAFPSLAVYRRETDKQDYLQGESGGVPNREIVLEELLMLWLENANPAFAPFLELFDDTSLERESPYPQMIETLHTFFDGMPGIDGDGTTLAGSRTKAGGQNLLDLLRAPALHAPHSLEAQLEYMRTRWGGFSLGRYLYRLLGSLDLIKEEEKPVFLGPGPIVPPVYDFTGQEQELERFSPDKDWMPRLVLMAKNAYVWLSQLAKKYGRPISQLDQIPDEELDQMAQQGFTGLWLIGLWERSVASKEIKHRLGNADAVASAYSLYDYQIAAALGGEAACQNLRVRAWARGIRLSSDMVPNHMGIDSRWVIDHPDWFLSVPEPPYPAYTFNSADLSHNDQVAIVLEDHYYDRSDAAVVFKRVDRWSGETRYIYHGNDGTSMPWNDTAQLDYLKAEVREGVIQTILHVARQFPVIRFDAAMTLAKRSIQRLWFPEPGSGGAIPSRAEHALTRAQFDAAIPEEFWREVVDRVAAEVPDTLLLAEAFWMMESYFVRSLGMHRVYNSAFMHMLRDENNGQYRVLMKNTLEFDPEILKRYVNFMSNPDERTAIDQFGKGDKYFGVCTVMLTMPGLPMFGHGQIEGFAEKYGMEYQRSYWDEQPDGDLIERHQREIFPLMHKRYLFAEVEHFRLYDFYGSDGGVNEDVFAYSNRFGDERSLVVYHNRYGSVRGWVRTSAAYSVKTGNGDERKLEQSTLGAGLGLRADDGCFYIFKDHTTSLEFIRSGKQLVDQGMYVELDAYRYQVYLDFREVQDNEWNQYSHLASYLDGRGVPSIDEALKEIIFQPLLQPFGELVNADMLYRLADARTTSAKPTTVLIQTSNGRATKTTHKHKIEQPVEAATPTEVTKELLDEVETKMVALLDAIAQFEQQRVDSTEIAKGVRQTIAAILQLPALEERFPLPGSPDYITALTNIHAHLDDDVSVWGTFFAWAFVRDLGKITGEEDAAEQSRSWIDEWLLGRVINRALTEMGLDDAQATRRLTLIKQMTDSPNWYASADDELPHRVLEGLLEDVAVQRLIGVNRYQSILWFDKAAFERLTSWMLTQAAIEISADEARIPQEVARSIAACGAIVTRFRAAADESGYQVEKLLEAVQPTEIPVTTETQGEISTARK